MAYLLTTILISINYALCLYFAFAEQPLGLPVGRNSSAQNSVSLEDVLGPVVIGKDGSTARITNWAKMSDVEKTRVKRIIGKRNRIRTAQLRAKAKNGANIVDKPDL